MHPTIVEQPNNLPVISTETQIVEIVESFLKDQDVKQNSRDLYKRTIDLYFDWVAGRGYTTASITRVQILEYKESLLARGLSVLTVGSYVTSVRRFYEWVEANGLGYNVAKGVKSPKRVRQFKKSALTPTQSKTLLNSLQDEALRLHFSGKGLRDYAIVNLLIRTGLRTIEAIRANIEDIVRKGDRRVLMVHGKGRDEKDNFVILTDKAFEPLENYLASRPKAKPTDPLFISEGNKSMGGRLVTRTISRVAKDALKDIGLNDRSFTAHSLRHTAGTNILRAGGSLADAQGVLRHANPATTQGYTYTFEEEGRLKTFAESLLDNLY